MRTPTFIPIRMATQKQTNKNPQKTKAKNQKIVTVGRMWRNWCIAGGNVKWYSCCGRQYGESLKRLNTELPYDSVAPLLGIYNPKELEAARTARVICTQM